MLKINKIKKISITAMAVVCALSSTAAISAGAVSSTNTGKTSLGYLVSSTVSYNGKTVSGTGEVVSGGPCSINVTASGYYKSGNYYVLSCSISDKIDNGQYLVKSTSGSFTLAKGVCTSVFNSATTVQATAT